MAALANRNTIAGLICLALAVWLFSLTFGLPQSPFVPIGPEFYPRIVLGVTAALAIAVAVEGVVAAGREEAPKARRNYRLVGLSFAVFFLYVVLLPPLGFRIATALFVAVLQAVIEPPAQARQWARVAVVAVLTSAATYLVFEHYLAVLLPRGAWTQF
jgi:putative tricarboxylic transport membrane protein